MMIMGEMMKRFLVVGIFSATVMGCMGKHHDLTTDTGTMGEGDKLLKSEFYDEARKQYYRIKTEFPQSPLQIEADLKIAESYYNEESYPAAATAYEDFIKTYPGRPEIVDALYKLGMCYVNQMPSTPQRDTRATHKVVDTLTRLMIDFPRNKYTAEVQQHIENARKQLADKIFAVGRFYEKRGEYASAARRFAEVVDQYGELPVGEEAMARQIKNLKKAGEAEKANEVATTFKSKFPQSKYNSLLE